MIISATDLVHSDELHFTLRSGLPWLEGSILSEDISDDEDCNAPTLEELMAGLPQLFSGNGDLEDFFLCEKFVAQSMKIMTQNFVNREFDFDLELLLNPLTQAKFLLMDLMTQEQLLQMAKKLLQQFTQLQSLIQSTNEQLKIATEQVHRELALKIAYKGRGRPSFENSRAMFEALQQSKAQLTKHIGDKFCSNLSEMVDNIIDLLYDINSLAESKVCNLLQPSIGYEEFHRISQQIEVNFNTESNFAIRDCAFASTLLDQIMVIYQEYILHLKNYGFVHTKQKFTYEIVSLDDHIRGQRFTKAST